MIQRGPGTYNSSGQPTFSPTPDIADRELADRLATALEGMVRQFAYWSDLEGGHATGGLSALEDAFLLLGWDDPHPAPEARCDEPGCMQRRTCGTPTPGGYRHTCYEHRP